MAITYTYKIIKIHTYPVFNELADVVKNIEYEDVSKVLMVDPYKKSKKKKSKKKSKR